MVSHRKPKITRIPSNTEYIDFTLPPGVAVCTGYFLDVYRLTSVTTQVAIYPQVAGHPSRFVIDSDITGVNGTYRVDVRHGTTILLTDVIEVVPFSGEVQITPVAAAPSCYPNPINNTKPAAPPSPYGHTGYGHCNAGDTEHAYRHVDDPSHWQ